MELSKSLKSLVVATAFSAVSLNTFALANAEADYGTVNCAIEPDRNEVAILAQEYGPDDLNRVLADKYGCDVAAGTGPLSEAAVILPPIYKQVISNTGNTYYEGLESCAYHPQREEFACSLSVRQRFGFGGFPAIGAGSNEWVTICVDYGNGMQMMDTASVHVHDEQFGASPYWYYAAIVQADKTLQSQIQNGRTLRARAILSWSAAPNSCTYRPVWGNQADFRIKLDP